MIGGQCANTCNSLARHSNYIKEVDVARTVSTVVIVMLGNVSGDFGQWREDMASWRRAHQDEMDSLDQFLRCYEDADTCTNVHQVL
jgi:hypothetical protein